MLFRKNSVNPCKIPLASLSFMTPTFGDKYPYKEPFPYETKKYGFFQELVDRTVWRFNENTKVILVEGCPGVGKTEFAHRLAKEFDLKVFDSVYNDELHIDWFTGYDLKLLNEFCTPRMSYYTMDMFYQNSNPEDKIACKMQWEIFRNKVKRYGKALQHLLSTGQGVVITRSALADQAYALAMKECGYLSKEAFHHYDEMRLNASCELIKPHLTIYLDSPISSWKEKTLKKNLYGEKTGAAFANPKYLAAIESNHKKVFLPEMKKHGEIMVIDWEEVGDDLDMDAIVHQISTFNLENIDKEELKFIEWYRKTEDDWGLYRRGFETLESIDELLASPNPVDCKEIQLDEEEFELDERLEEHPIFADKPGYSERLGHPRRIWNMF